MRILIAEDEVSTARALQALLKRNMYTVDIVHDGLSAWDYVCANEYDLVVLDIMMPGIDGLEVLRRMRTARNFTAVMLLTAKSEVSDRVAGLTAGADDYLPKPFDTEEFLARVRALCRRNGSYTEAVITNGNLVLDSNRFVMSVGGQEISLNNKEYQLMETFMKHPGFVFSAERLMDLIWGDDCESNIDVVWTHIGFVRKKLKALGADVSIKTVRGAGYILKAGE